MRMIEIDYEAQPPIDGYGPGGFRIAGEWHEGGVLVMLQGPQPLSDVTVDAFGPVLAAAADLDVVLVGMGADIAPLPAEVRSALEDAGLGYETMSTPSACRTYNVLLTEDRRVAVALLPTGTS